MADKFITLKEASEISGYAPDYIGQLIRKGKLPGKQVYHAVAWMTTEEAVRGYLEKGRSVASSGEESHGASLPVFHRIHQTYQRLLNEIRTEVGVLKMFRGLMYVFAVVLAGFLLLLFYVFSVSLDHKLQERAVEQIRMEGERR